MHGMAKRRLNPVCGGVLRWAFFLIFWEGPSIAIFTSGHNAHDAKTFATTRCHAITYDATFLPVLVELPKV